MSSRRYTLSDVKTSNPEVTFEMSLSYRDGNNPFGDARQQPRGFYLQATYIETRDGMRYALLGRGSSSFVEAAPRFNQRRFDALRNSVPTSIGYAALVERVLAKNNLEIVPQEDVACV